MDFLLTRVKLMSLVHTTKIQTVFSHNADIRVHEYYTTCRTYFRITFADSSKTVNFKTSNS